MIEYSIQVSKDTASPAIAEKIRKLDPHRIATAIVPPLREYWRDHMAALPRNSKGYPSTGFWEDGSRRITGLAVGPDALLRCDKVGVRQRYYGGPIHAVNVTNLTIPIAPESYGTTAKDWGDTLTLVILSDGRKFLALWMGNKQERDSYRAAGLGKKARRSEVSTRRVQKYAAQPQEHPRVIVFRSSGRSGSEEQQKAEKHGNIKFLFRLKPEVEQAGNPGVIPEDMAVRAREEVLAAIE